MSWPKPSRFSDESMTDLLVAEHNEGSHQEWPVEECPLCDAEIFEEHEETEFWEEPEIGGKS